MRDQYHIIVFHTSGGDWKAFFSDDPFNFAFGCSGAEAVGNLLKPETWPVHGALPDLIEDTEEV